MTTIRVKRPTRWVTIDKRTANDSRLSFKARGILLWLLDKPDDWETSAERIQQQGKEGRDAIRSALKELEQYGYLTRFQWRDNDGKFHTEWTVSEESAQLAPHTGFRRRLPAGGFPSDLINPEPNTDIAKLDIGCGKCEKGWIFDSAIDVKPCPTCRPSCSLISNISTT